MVSLVSSVRQWLLQQWKLKVPDDWLEACVEWIQSEHQGPGPLRTSDLNTMVYEQWLVCDLREIEASCLPANLKQQAKVQLNNVFNLQINSVLDVGAPFYGQLQKVRGTDNANVEVTATQATQARWEPKPSRMLMLSVTDGTHDVKIMEYRPIQCLDVNTTPGTKIQVSGNVLCRMGVIMAVSQNIRVLGGEVDSLVEEKTPENMLTTALNNARMLAENPPSPKRASFDQAMNRSNTSSNRPATSTRQPLSSLGTSHKNQPPLMNRPQNPTTCTNAQQYSVSSGTNQMAQLNHRQPVSTVKPYVPPPRVPQMQSSLQPKPPSIDDADEFMDDLDVDALQSQWEGGCVDDLDEEMLAEQFEFQERQAAPLTEPRAISPQPSTSFSSRQENSSLPSFPRKPMHQQRTRDFSGDGQPHAKRPLLKIHVSPQAAQSITKAENKISAMKSSPPKPASSSDSPLFNSASDSQHLRSDLGVSKKKNLDFGLMSQPFSYLSSVATAILPSATVVVRVKAIVSTLLSKLESNNGSLWSLSVRLNDGSAYLDVDLSNEFLTSLIGFTALECLEMKNRSRSEPSLKVKLVKALKDCQQKLVELCSILELQFGPGIPKPRVLRQIPITSDIIDQLSSRLSSH